MRAAAVEQQPINSLSTRAGYTAHNRIKTNQRSKVMRAMEKERGHLCAAACGGHLDISMDTLQQMQSTLQPEPFESELSSANDGQVSPDKLRGKTAFANAAQPSVAA